MLQYFENRRKTDMKLELLYEIAKTPTVGKLFEVRPLEIDRRNFEKPMRNDSKEEWTRLLIKAAFAEVDRHPEKYASPIYTLIPEKNWGNHWRNIAELKAYANDLGGEMADWIMQALEWAQRINNGETWNNVCTCLDPIIYLRMVIWNDGHVRLVGGSDFFRHDFLSTRAFYCFGADEFLFVNTVPLVAFKQE